MKKNSCTKLIGLLLCIAGLCLTGSASAQDLLWAGAFGDNAMVRKTVVDTAGNIYLTGTFNGGPTDFDPGTGVASLNPTGWDIFLLKLNADGVFQWVRQYEGGHVNGGGEPTGITLDSTGNIYLAGYFGSFLDNDSYTIDFDPGPAVNAVTSVGVDYINYYADRDVFVVKLDAQGNPVWTRSLGSMGIEIATSICVDHDGNILVSGNFDSPVDFDPGAGTASMIPAGGAYDADAFIWKLGNDGAYVWAKQFGGTNSAITPNSIRTDANGNVYTMGAFRKTVDFDPGAGVQNLTTGVSAQGWDVLNIFVSKLDAAGNYVWARNMGDVPPGGEVVQYLVPSSMSLDNSGNILISGDITDTADMDPGPGTAYLYSNGNTDAFVVKLDATGELSWAKSFGGYEYDAATIVRADQAGNVYAMGYYKGIVDFDPSDTGDHTITSATSRGGLYISRFSSSGIFERTAVMDVSLDGNIGLNGMDMAIHPGDNSIYANSNFTGTVDFDPGPGNISLSAPNGNAFVVRLKNCHQLTSTLVTTACEHFTFDGITYDESGVYQHAFSTLNGCDSIVTLTLTISQPPVATAVRQGSTLHAANAGAAYQWIDCGNGNTALPGAVQQSYTATANGQYAVIVSENGCSDTSECIPVDGITDITNERWENNRITLYPNPATTGITLQSTQSLQQATIRVFTVLGQIASEVTKHNSRFFHLDISQLSVGLYFVEISDGKNTATFKFTKE